VFSRVVFVAFAEPRPFLMDIFSTSVDLSGGEEGGVKFGIYVSM